MSLNTCRNCGHPAFDHDVELPFLPKLGAAGQILSVGIYTRCPLGGSKFEPEVFHMLVDLIGWDAVNAGRTPPGEKRTLLRKLDIALGFSRG